MQGNAQPESRLEISWNHAALPDVQCANVLRDGSPSVVAGHEKLLVKLRGENCAEQAFSVVRTGPQSKSGRGPRPQRWVNFTQRISMLRMQSFGLFPSLPQRSGKPCSVGLVELCKTICVLLVFSAAAVVASPAANTFTTLASFNGTKGASPSYAPLVQGLNGNLYGTTSSGGANGYGTIFQITTGGTLTTLHSFNNTDGAYPCAGLIQATNGNLYGTTYSGGANGYGTVFDITAAGTLTTLHNFDLTDGAYPCAQLVQMLAGDFYGTTLQGGANGYGTIFTINARTLTTVHSFSLSDGASPYTLVFPYPGLMPVTYGDLYGITSGGGANGDGTVFKITAGNAVSTKHSFDMTDGLSPYASLVQGTTGNFFGTTEYGGSGSCVNGCGTVFQSTPLGAVTTLHSFNVTDGQNPQAGLVQATDGNFYGTTYSGGANGYGTVFEITIGGTLTTLYNFDVTDGEYPQAGLLQATDGNFYGVTYSGGASGDGTVFQLVTGLAPFVQALQSYGKVGTKAYFLGTNLTGATSVSFNGTPATFTVVSASEITATVPIGATTGTVAVTTPSGTLNSNVVFRVTPQITSFTPPSGPAGTPVIITGISLTQAEAVTIGGAKVSSFTVNSDTQVTAIVGTGATGQIQITTPGGIAASTTSFTFP
jgi:uncharacterized repeat protein (TIGR03803 family)